ncbi:MAG: biosynthetic peptidoglycan transglycosylase [Candidatus Eiseniibacteriota bacterium]
MLTRTRLLATVGVIALLLALPRLITLLAGAALERQARAHHARVSWRSLEWRPPLSLRLTGLAVSDANDQSIAAAESLGLAIDPGSVLMLHPRAASLELAHARLRWHPSAAADADTLAPEEEALLPHARAADRSGSVRAAVRSLVRVLLLPARKLPRLQVRDVDVLGHDERVVRLHLDGLELGGERGVAHLAAMGEVTAIQRMPFTLEIDYGADDRLTGGARFILEPQGGGKAEALSLSLSGRVTQDRHRGRIVLADSTRLYVGRLPLRLSGLLEREGPHVAFELGAEGVSPALCLECAPHAILGPLAELALTGTFDYAASLDLDFSRPDSVRLAADVTPHGLELDRGRTRLPITALDQPFVARIHLPHDRIEQRDLSPANPHYVPIGELDSTLIHAVLTNEDGAFFQHRGFNLAAVRGSIADNIHAAAWRRGAGTITMQLVRNLYLGHERTLSRKGQEVVLAWVLEHLSGVSKARMLEIYLNIVEWSPESCGADEAAHYYFAHDARALSVPEALYLATVLPAPEKWRWRFAPDGSLKSFERAQMHFIGRAMIRRGWLEEGLLPAADSLAVELRGPARAALTGAGVRAALDSLRPEDRGGDQAPSPQ